MLSLIHCRFNEIEQNARLVLIIAVVFFLGFGIELFLHIVVI
jgi:hypothetical protein